MRVAKLQVRSKGKANIPPIKEPGHYQGNSIVCLYLAQCEIWHSCLLLPRQQPMKERRVEFFWIPTHAQANTKRETPIIYHTGTIQSLSCTP